MRCGAILLSFAKYGTIIIRLMENEKDGSLESTPTEIVDSTENVVGDTAENSGSQDDSKPQKMKTTKDMTQGSVKKNILTFAIPILFSQIFQQLYNSADSLIVGNFLGKTSLAAVGSSAALILLMVGFFEGCSSGAGVLIAKFFGAGDKENTSKAIHTNVVFGLISGTILTVLGVLLTPYILGLLNIDEEVLPESIMYFRYYFLGVLAVVMYNNFTGILRAVGDSKRPLIYLIVSSVLNIILDLIFVGWMGLGVEWAAIATTISQTVSAVLCFIQLRRKGTVYRIEFKKLKIDKAIFVKILKYGMPTGIQSSVIAMSNLFVQSQINAFGTDAMAGYAAYAKIEGFGFLPINCISMSISTFIGQNLGAMKYDRAKQGAKFVLIMTPIVAECIGLFIFLLAPYLVAMFNADPSVVEYGTMHCRITTLFFCLLTFSHIVAAILRGSGRAIVPMSIMLVCWCLIRAIYIALVSHYFHDIKLVYWAYPITWTLSTIVFFIYYKVANWTKGFESKKDKVALVEGVSEEGEDKVE